MSIIRNTKTLRERAEWHAAKDHVMQGTYGRGDVNGKAEFKGCVIGCLATPHGDALVEYLRDNLSIGEGIRLMSRGDYSLTSDIYEQFGIEPELMRLAEDVFEGLSTHGAAINFVRDFVRALPEGAKIDAEDAGHIRDRLRGLPMDSRPARLFVLLAEYDPEVTGVSY